MLMILLMCLFVVTSSAGEDGTIVEDTIEVTVVGTIRAGILAIGGETTGTTITAKGITWELNLGNAPGLWEAAESLNGRKARVRGTLEHRLGVEIPERWIVTAFNGVRLD